MFTYDATKEDKSEKYFFYIDGIPIKHGENSPSEKQERKLKANTKFQKMVKDGLIVLPESQKETKPEYKKTVDETPVKNPKATKTKAEKIEVE